MMKFAVLLAELKRRKVFRVAAVYGATSFVILQLADIIFPPLGLPQWTITLVAVLAVIGFPLAIALTWIFEATPDGLRRTAPAQNTEIEAILAQPRSRRWPAGIAALLGIVLLAGGIAWTVSQRGGGRASEYDSIAVLPFTNMSGDADNEYFGDGLAEELLNALSNIEGLKVAARTSAFAFKDTKMDVRAIGDTLGVSTVLEGSVRRSADRIRITAQLIDANTGYHLWSDTYDRPLTDLFTVQDAIAREIVGALAGRFTVSQDDELYRGGTKDVKAYDLYLLGRQKWVTRQVPLLREAVVHFEQAIARDSSFALAWSGLADAIDALAWRDPSGRPRVPEAKYAAQRALVLEPQLAEAWASLGVLVSDFDRDFRFAELALRHAIALRPSYSSAYQWLADLMRYTGRLDEALETGARAREFDPKNRVSYATTIEVLVSLGRFTEARQAADRLLSTGYRERGSLANLLASASHLGYSADQVAELGRAWAIASDFPRSDDAALIARAFIDRTLRPRVPELLETMARERVRARDLALFALSIEDREAAIKYLEQAVSDGEPALVSIGTVRAYDPLRKDPRFIRIVEQLGVPNGI